MVNPKVFRIADVNESVIAAPVVGMNNGLDADTPGNKGLERFSLDI